MVKNLNSAKKLLTEMATSARRFPAYFECLIGCDARIAPSSAFKICSEIAAPTISKF